jgi:hypothetical protein
MYDVCIIVQVRAHGTLKACEGSAGQERTPAGRTLGGPSWALHTFRTRRPCSPAPPRATRRSRHCPPVACAPISICMCISVYIHICLYICIYICMYQNILIYIYIYMYISLSLAQAIVLRRRRRRRRRVDVTPLSPRPSTRQAGGLACLQPEGLKEMYDMIAFYKQNAQILKARTPAARACPPRTLWRGRETRTPVRSSAAVAPPTSAQPSRRPVPRGPWQPPHAPPTTHASRVIHAPAGDLPGHGFLGVRRRRRAVHLGGLPRCGRGVRAAAVPRTTRHGLHRSSTETYGIGFKQVSWCPDCPFPSFRPLRRQALVGRVCRDPGALQHRDHARQVTSLHAAISLYIVAHRYVSLHAAVS